MKAFAARVLPTMQPFCDKKQLSCFCPMRQIIESKYNIVVKISTTGNSVSSSKVVFLRRPNLEWHNLWLDSNYRKSIPAPVGKLQLQHHCTQTYTVPKAYASFPSHTRTTHAPTHPLTLDLQQHHTKRTHGRMGTRAYRAHSSGLLLAASIMDTSHSV